MQTLHLECEEFTDSAICEFRFYSSPSLGSAAKRAAVTAVRRIWQPNPGVAGQPATRTNRLVRGPPLKSATILFNSGSSQLLLGTMPEKGEGSVGVYKPHETPRMPELEGVELASFISRACAMGIDFRRHWTVPRRGEPGSEFWEGSEPLMGGGSTWLTGSYDPETDTLFEPTGNPFPDSEDADRGGDNLYTDSILAMNPANGALERHHRFTPHDVSGRDANKPPVLS
jgi:hypothetical protein